MTRRARRRNGIHALTIRPTVTVAIKDKTTVRELGREAMQDGT